MKSPSNPVSEDVLNKNSIPDETDEIIYDTTKNNGIKKINNTDKEQESNKKTESTE